jgi:hypothetical protein
VTARETYLRLASDFLRRAAVNRRFRVALISVGPARTLAQNLLLILGNRAVVSSFPTTINGSKDNEWFTRATQLSNVSTRWMAGRFPPLILLVPYYLRQQVAL